MAVSLDLYGMLVRAERPPEPWTAVADALGVDLSALVDVGDDPRTDGGGRTAAIVYVTGKIPLTVRSDDLGARR